MTAANPIKPTFGQLRAQGVRRLMVRCRYCGHFSVLVIDRWRDEARLSDVESGLVCSICKARGGELSPAAKIAVPVD